MATRGLGRFGVVGYGFPMEVPVNKQEMLRAQGTGVCHECSPAGWRDIPVVSGSYDLDATLMHRSNPALPDRVGLYVKSGRGAAYEPRTGYSGYHGYSGDD